MIYTDSLYELDSAAEKLQYELRIFFRDTSGEKYVSRSQIDSLKQSSVCSDKVSELLFVKWIQASGKSIIDPDFVYDVNKPIICIDNFDTTDKPNGRGIHLVSPDCALGYIIQENLVSKLNELALLVCSIPVNTRIIRHSFRLYSKVRVSDIKPLFIVPFIKYFKPLPMCDEKTKSLICSSSIDSENYIRQYRFNSETQIWQLAYWIANSDKAHDIVGVKRCLMRCLPIKYETVEIPETKSNVIDKSDKEIKQQISEKQTPDCSNTITIALIKILKNNGILLPYEDLQKILLWEQFRNLYIDLAKHNIEISKEKMPNLNTIITTAWTEMSTTVKDTNVIWISEDLQKILFWEKFRIPYIELANKIATN